MSHHKFPSLPHANTQYIPPWQPTLLSQDVDFVYRLHKVDKIEPQVAMFARCSGPVWVYDDFTQCFNHEYVKYLAL